MSKETENAEEKKKRLTFDFAPKAYNALKEMQKEIGAEQPSAVLRRSLILYQWVLKVQREGGKVFRQAKNGAQFEIDLDFEE